MQWGNRSCSSGEPPDTAVLYSMHDVADIAGVSRVAISRLCREGNMPPWRVVHGQKCWDQAHVMEAVMAARDGPDHKSAA